MEIKKKINHQNMQKYEAKTQGHAPSCTPAAPKP
jgi:hypothetical protein